jgi:hypothetical protein
MNPVVVSSARACALHPFGIALAKLISDHIREAIDDEAVLQSGHMALRTWMRKLMGEDSE